MYTSTTTDGDVYKYNYGVICVNTTMEDDVQKYYFRG